MRSLRRNVLLATMSCEVAQDAQAFYRIMRLGSYKPFFSRDFSEPSNAPRGVETLDPPFLKHPLNVGSTAAKASTIAAVGLR